jgi:hypothetical protein
VPLLNQNGAHVGNSTIAGAVFCYALYVTPPPTAGTITIEKRVTGAPAGHPRTRLFTSMGASPSTPMALR